MQALTSFDKVLLNLLQGNLPVCSRPFQKLAEELGTEESVVLERLKELKKEGYLRRIGTFFNSSRLGYEGTLVALKVREDRVEPVAKAINTLAGATHNYEREGGYNLWFTLLTPSPEVEKGILARIRALDGVESMLNLRANRKYKINVQFKLA